MASPERDVVNGCTRTTSTGRSVSRSHEKLPALKLEHKETLTAQTRLLLCYLETTDWHPSAVLKGSSAITAVVVWFRKDSGLEKKENREYWRKDTQYYDYQIKHWIWLGYTLKEKKGGRRVGSA